MVSVVTAIAAAKEAATWAENVEKEGIRAVSNNSDPMRDDFVEHLMRIWKDYGGQISHSGPLFRFLSAVTGASFESAGAEPMKEDAVKECVRRIQARWELSA